MIAVGGLVLALVYLAGAWKDRSATSFRAAYRALIWGALPGFVVMRVAAQWLFSAEDLEDLDPEPAWIGLGFIAGDAGFVLLLAATITAGISSRRALAAGDAGGNSTAIRVTSALIALLLVAYVVTIWAMTTKPS
jgi:anti-sigma factor RsiW